MRNGLSDLPLYKVWSNMKSRCINPNDKNFKHYGGRGIRVCDEWQDSYNNFCEWALENGYERGLTLDRINNDKGYSPGNCRWTTFLVQSRNRRCNQLITYKGKTQCVSAWAEELGIGNSALRNRIKKGWPIDKILDPNCQRAMSKGGKYSVSRMITYHGKTQSIADWSKETGVQIGTIFQRIRKGREPWNLFDNEMKKPEVAP